MTAKIIFLKGLPGSGKTTWAKQYVIDNSDSIRVNKDDLRELLHSGKHSKGREQFILDIQDKIINNALLSGKTVLVDNTHLNPKHEDHLRKLFPDVEFEVHDFTDVSVQECIDRDSKRENKVGRGVILKMWRDYLLPKPANVVDGREWAILCDLDGTLCQFTGNPYDRDFSQDSPSWPVIDILKAVSKQFVIMLVSGRSNKFEEVTRQWLETYAVPYNLLFMRQDGDKRKDSVLKQEIYDDRIKPNFNVRFVIDDRPQVKRMWIQNGLFVLDVNQYDLEF